MNVVIPMAGLGSRFREAGWELPKPLIPVRGRPMYAWAADSLPLADATSLVFIVLDTLPHVDDLVADVEARYGALGARVVRLPALTAGQAATVLTVRDAIANDAPLLIHNADTAFDVDAGWARDAVARGADGALLVFPSDEQRWSYSRVDDATGLVVEVREKVVVSPWASTGTYWFRRGADFVRLAEARAAAGRREAGEFYVGPLYNDLIAEGGRVVNYEIDRLYCFGTPADLAATLASMEQG